ncbi:Receptor L-domain, partial [Trinorchestia longiramus]
MSRLLGAVRTIAGNLLIEETNFEHLEFLALISEVSGSPVSNDSYSVVIADNPFLRTLPKSWASLRVGGRGVRLIGNPRLCLRHQQLSAYR